MSNEHCAHPVSPKRRSTLLAYTPDHDDGVHLSESKLVSKIVSIQHEKLAESTDSLTLDDYMQFA